MSVLSRVIFHPDTTPPTVPGSVAATALSQTAIRITWAASTDTGGAGLAGYRVYRSTTSGGTYAQVGTDLTTASLSFDDTSLSASTQRFYRVLAFDGNGNASALSSIVNATTQAEPPAPSGFYYAGPVLGSLTPTIYAAPTALGNGSGSSEANARALSTALASATAGAIIGVLPGVYSKISGGERYAPAWRVTGTGTALSPIIVVAKYSAIDLSGKSANQRWTAADYAAVFAHPNRSEMRHTGVSTDGGGSGGPAFGSVDNNYVYWFGLCADEANAQPHRDTGLSILWSTTGSRIMRCVLYARDPRYVTFDYDNHPNVRLENAIGCVVSDNALDGDFAGNGHNHCCIQRYESRDTVIEHNFTGGLHAGIYLKDQDTSRNEIVRYNYCTNPQAGIEVLNVNIGVTDTDQVYQNLIVGSAEGLIYQSRGTNIQAHHNTLVGPCAGGGSSQGWQGHHNSTGCYCRESILVGTSGSMFIDQAFRTGPVNGSNYNRFYRTGTQFTSRYNGATRSNIETWRSATGQDLNSSVGDPGFMNQATGDYRLAPGSACLTMSESGGPVGCYITGTETIGPRYA